MAKIELLMPGFPGRHDQGVLGHANCCLIRSDKLIVTDPGHTGRVRYLNKRLKEVNVDPKDVDIVFLEELHWDHFMNYELFPNARIMVPKKDWEFLSQMKGYELQHSKHAAANLKADGAELVDEEGALAKDVDIIKVPGHTPGHTALVVQTPDGVACVCSDAIHYGWCYFTETAYSLTMGGTAEEATQSVRKIKQKATIFYPGHDTPFTVKNGKLEYLSDPSLDIRLITNDPRTIHTKIDIKSSKE